MRSSSTGAMNIAAILMLAAGTSAFWRMPCRARSGLARIDPLVSPGEASAHAHAIHGSSGFSSTSDTAALLAGECTSCQVSQDKSAYWTPAIYFQDSSTGEFTLVEQVGGMLAYYLLYPNAGETNVTAFPTGFEMIAGDSDMRTFPYPFPDLPKSNWNVAPYNTQAFLQQAALGFNCLDYSKAPEASLYRHFLPDKSSTDANCPDGIRFELMFPSCWNGKDITSANKKSHVAYPSEVMTGDCPAGFETRLVSLFYETIWNTAAFVGKDGQFVISNGDTTGYGYHGDFIMGWDESFLQSAVNTCTNPSGQIQDCALFDIQSSADYSNCNISTADFPPQIVNENVVGAMPELPGDCQVYGAASAAPSSTPAALNIPVLSDLLEGGAPKSDDSAPGAVFALKSSLSTSSLTPTPTSTPSPVITEAPTTTSSYDTQSYFTTVYTTQGNTVEEIKWIEEIITETICDTDTIYATVTAKRRHLHKHLKGF